MELRETILAQSAAAVGIPVLLGRTAPPSPTEQDLQQEYLRRSAAGLALLDAAPPDVIGPAEEAGVLALNFHHVPREHHATVGEQLRRVADLGPSLLTAAGATDPRPVLVAFYDGYREAALFGAEECLRLGLRAAFLPVFASEDPARAQLTDADLADLASVHALGFHTHSHRAGGEITEDDLEQEVVTPLRRLTAAAGGPPELGAYRGGGRFDPSRPADRALQGAGLRWWLSNWSLEAVPAADQGG